MLADGKWDFRLSSHEDIETAVDALFIASIAANSYLSSGVGSYSNWSVFELIVQQFDRDGSGPITIVSGMKGGERRVIGGYDHGEATFSQPPQCAVGIVECELDLLKSLNRALSEAPELAALIEAATGFMEQAFTDRPARRAMTELIGTATAFEQLYDVHASKFELATRFGNLFQRFSRHSAEEALSNRSGIFFVPEHAAAQRQWPVHKAWIHELYHVRSKAAHTRDPQQLQWGWTIDEHLLMGAWVFPLAVELNLASVGLYDIATHDRGRCEAVDRLLIEPAWRDRILEGDWAGRSMWHMTVGRTCDRVKWAAALESIQRATQEGSQETAE